MASSSLSKPTPDCGLKDRIAAVRHFNRFYTRQIGLLQEEMLESPYSLTQLRVLYELARVAETTATDLAQKLGLDHGYLSRILRAFTNSGFLSRRLSPTDRRQTLLSLTTKGRTAFKPIEMSSEKQVSALLGLLGSPDQARLVSAMQEIERLIARNPPPAAFRLRSHQPGDMGWVVRTHATLYAEEYGFDITFEALVAEIVVNFIKKFDAARERCWIAELDGEPVGSVFLVRESDEIAKLRLLIVDPRARGLGVGARLTRECIDYAHACGYRMLRLWTQRNLVAARHIYECFGFRLVAEQPHHSFGQNLIGETWELELN